MEKQTEKPYSLSRRAFLGKIGAATTLLTLLPVVGWATLLKHPKTLSNETIWATFSAAQQHLFPNTPNAPNTQTIHATQYLHKVLKDPRVSRNNKKILNKGVYRLEILAKKITGTSFYQLHERQRETVLQKFKKSSIGRRWISLMLHYIFEALLSDPIYGSNPHSIGWTWLQHKPGFPTPPTSKRYFQL